MILIAPDKFKGTYTADAMCGLIEERLRGVGISVPFIVRPMADGGEGISGIIMPGARMISRGVYEQNGRRLAVSSELVGFSAFEGREIPLMRRSSRALGEAVEPGIPTEIAIGGTATSDAGAGFLQGLGVKFFDSEGREIPGDLCPANLHKVASADLKAIKKYDIAGIVDVRASLTASPLSALDFAPQKALENESLAGLGEALRHFQNILGGTSEWDGAGGGIGYAVASVCGAPCRSGGEAAVDGLDVDWEQVRLVVTGEGCVDSQTVVGGKLVDAVCRKASSHGIPVLVLYGRKEGSTGYPWMAQINDDWPGQVKSVLGL